LDKQEMQKQHKQSMRLGVIAVVAALVLLLLVHMLLPAALMSGGGGGEYRFYMGPVLPMTVVSGGETVTAERHVDFDFAPFSLERKSNIHPRQVIVTDRYTVDGSGEATLAYGFHGQLTDPPEQIPEILVNGELVESKLYPSVDANSLVDHAKKWEQYRDAVANNDFLGEALETAPDWEQPVTVYHFSDLHWTDPSGEPYVYLHVQYDFDPEHTTLWRYGGAGSVSIHEDGTGHWHIQLPNDPEQFWLRDEAWLLVLGEDIQNMEFESSMGPRTSEEAPAGAAAYELEKTQSTFGEMVWQFAADYGTWRQYDGSEVSEYDTQEILYTGAMKRLLDGIPDNGTNYQSIDELFNATMHDRGLIYAVFTVTFPAEITVRYHQEASLEGLGKKTPTDGLDLATTLGSALTFTDLSASVTNTNQIEIIDQNFGFDLDAGITETKLDTSQEWYFLDASVKS